MGTSDRTHWFESASPAKRIHQPQIQTGRGVRRAILQTPQSKHFDPVPQRFDSGT